MNDVARWLADLGLGKYLEVFEANEIDFDTLPDLTDDDFREMNVPIGPRRKMRRAIRALSPSPAMSSAVPGASEASPWARSGGAAERRQLTVMFSDLAGSTELSTRIDPEELRDINRAYQDAVTVAVERFGGYVARYMGDGVLAYFGYPLAHENDAERAARAALEIVAAIPALDTPMRLSVRVGIATGPVVVGDVIGTGAARESAVVGETPNLAARLEGVAGPDRIAISAATYRLIKGRFEFESLGRPPLKGLKESGEVFRVLRVRDGARFDREQASELTPLVGRAPELEVLARRWQLTVAGDGQVVFIRGEAGIGKSRLLKTFLELATPVPIAVVDLHCSVFAQNDAFHPIVDYLARVVGLTSAPDLNAHTPLLATWLGESADAVELAVPILAHLLSLPVDEALPPEITPQVQKARAIAVVVDRLVRLTVAGPVFVLVEDAQWADPSTWELLDALTEAGASAPLLIALTSRSRDDTRWQGRDNVTALALNRLGQRDSAELVSHLAGAKTLPDPLMSAIVEKSDGTPLFVEELTRNVLETGPVRASDDVLGPDDCVHAVAIPSTLSDSLMARLDRLGPAKEIAQVGAVFGPEFSHDQIARLCDFSPGALQEGLAMLTSVGVLSRRGVPPASRYAFRQSLIRETAYSSLLLARRRALHGKVAAVLEDLPADRVSERDSALAYHHERAGNVALAIRHASLAAEAQAGEFAVREAIRIYEHAVRLAQGAQGAQGADGEIAMHTVAEMLHRLAELMFTQGRFEDSSRYASRRRDLARRPGAPGIEARALVDMAHADMWRKNFPVALRHANEAAVLADQAGTVGAHISGAMLSGYVHGVSGRLPEAQEKLDQGAALAEQHAEHAHVAPILFMSACIQNWTGNYDRAITIADRGRDSAHRLGQIAHYLRCHWAVGTSRIGKGDYEGGYRDLREGLAIAEKMGDRAYIPRYLNTLGWLFAECHAYEAAIEPCRRALEFDRGSTAATGVERIAFSQANWADALLGLGDLPAAREMLDSVHGLATNPRTHEWMRWRYATHVLATFAEYWLAAGDPKQARQWASRCLEVAGEKRSWKYVAMARRTLGLAHLHARDFDAARAALLDSKAIAQRIGHPGGIWRAHAGLASLARAARDSRAQVRHRVAARKVLEASRDAITDEMLARVFATSGEARRLLDGE